MAEAVVAVQCTNCDTRLRLTASSRHWILAASSLFGLAAGVALHDRGWLVLFVTAAAGVVAASTLLAPLGTFEESPDAAVFGE